MNHVPSPSIGNSKIFLIGALISTLLDMDWMSLVEYSIKAVVGGMIWLGFKIASDWVSWRVNKKSNCKKTAGGEK